jgi:hypothetical protein
MDPVGFFYYSLGAGFLILVGCFVAITWRIVNILTDVRTVTENTAGLTDDLTALKDGVKVAGITLVQNLLEKAKKKGGAAKKHVQEEE